jgi:polyisoprenoid-binding protein YceI
MDMTTLAQDAAVSTWQFDPAHTTVGFSVRHMMITTVKGRFADVSGEVVLNEAEPGLSRVRAVIDTASIDTRMDARDTHLRSPDFFDVEKYPHITFESKGVEARGAGGLAVTGVLTIRGVSREVVLDVEEEGRGVDPWGGERIGFTASTRIDRTEFGLNWNQALEAGGVLVANEVKITLDVQLVRA